MKKVKFFASYCSEEQIKNNIISSWGKGSNVYKDLIITSDSDYDFAVLLNTAMPDKEIARENIIGFSHEPRLTVGLRPDYENYIEKKVSEYYISNNKGLPGNFKEGFSFVCPFEFGKSENVEYDHANRMSMILSLSNFMPGHTMRHELLKMILKSDMDIHFYANGLNKIYSDPRVKEFDWDIFGKPYEDYKYQIVIENIIDNNWSTEKLTNCIIKETLPIYYGSKKCLDMFYPDGLVLELDDNINLNFEKIKYCYYNMEYDNKITQEAKDKLYNGINLLEFLHQKFA
jgi:hypothetical protein